MKFPIHFAGSSPLQEKWPFGTYLLATLNLRCGAQAGSRGLPSPTEGMGIAARTEAFNTIPVGPLGSLARCFKDADRSRWDPFRRARNALGSCDLSVSLWCGRPPRRLSIRKHRRSYSCRQRVGLAQVWSIQRSKRQANSTHDVPRLV